MKIVIASGNKNKILEIEKIFAQHQNFENLYDKITLIPQEQLRIPEVEENGTTFVENALIKAKNAGKYTDLPVIADDSGLEVDALLGKPGVYSARFAGERATAGDNILKVLKEMRGVPKHKRAARFRCAIVFLRSASDQEPIICQETFEGSITYSAMGVNGFGYEPIFWVPAHKCALAQLSREEKNKISARAQAVRKLKTLMMQNY